MNIVRSQLVVAHYIDIESRAVHAQYRVGDSPRTDLFFLSLFSPMTHRMHAGLLFGLYSTVVISVAREASTRVDAAAAVPPPVSEAQHVAWCVDGTRTTDVDTAGLSVKCHGSPTRAASRDRLIEIRNCRSRADADSSDRENGYRPLVFIGTM